jgi:hypothetical protein
MHKQYRYLNRSHFDAHVKVDLSILKMEALNMPNSGFDRMVAKAYSVHPVTCIVWRSTYRDSCAEIRRKDGERGRLPWKREFLVPMRSGGKREGIHGQRRRLNFPLAGRVPLGGGARRECPDASSAYAIKQAPTDRQEPGRRATTWKQAGARRKIAFIMWYGTRVLLREPFCLPLPCRYLSLFGFGGLR